MTTKAACNAKMNTLYSQIIIESTGANKINTSIPSDTNEKVAVKVPSGIHLLTPYTRG